MIVESAVYSVLSTDSLVAVAVGDRIRPVNQFVPVDELTAEDFPHILYAVSAGQGYPVISGQSSTRGYTITLDVFALDYDQLKATVDAARTSLDGYRSLPIQGIFFQDTNDVDEPVGFHVQDTFAAFTTA